MGRLLGRSAPVGMILDSGHGRITAKDGKGGRSVTVHGTPGELLLFAFGRQSVADVELDGSPADIAALRGAGWRVIVVWECELRKPETALPELLQAPDTQIHLYGKAEVKPGRKMGHVNRITG